MEGGKAKGERRREGKPNERSDALPSRLAKIQDAMPFVSHPLVMEAPRSRGDCGTLWPFLGQ